MYKYRLSTRSTPLRCLGNVHNDPKIRYNLHCMLLEFPLVARCIVQVYKNCLNLVGAEAHARNYKNKADNEKDNNKS